MAIRATFWGASTAVLMTACATVPQGPVLLANDQLGSHSGRVGVVLSEPKIDLYLPGADCLPCFAAAIVINSSLSSYAHILKDDELPELKGELVELLRKKGVNAVAVDGVIDASKLSAVTLGPNYARRDFSDYKDRFDRLLVIDIEQLGFERAYASYVPVGAPKAIVKGSAYIVNLKTHALEWYETVAVLKSAQGEWSEPPSFPGLTNAFFQAIEVSKDQLKKPFAN